MGNRFSRRVASGAGLSALAVALICAVSAGQKPFVPDAPACRQKGPAGAPVVIGEFADFECPACHAAYEPLKQLEDMFPGKIRTVFKHLPWDRVHPKARDAAAAAECAGRQGKFWEMHALLYGRWEDWVRNDKHLDVFAEYAKKTGLDMKSYAACVRDPSVTAAIDADVRDASDHWVNSTPTFFVNGRRVVGARQLRTVGLGVIEKALGAGLAAKP